MHKLVSQYRLTPALPGPEAGMLHNLTSVRKLAGAMHRSTLVAKYLTDYGTEKRIHC
jgi:hypothetical protein